MTSCGTISPARSSADQEFFAQPGGRFHAALYELEDEQLEGFLAANAERLDLILSDAGSGSGEDAVEARRQRKRKKAKSAAKKKKGAVKKSKKVTVL